MSIILHFFYWLIAIIKGDEMAERERRVEKYLDSEILKLGGITRKWTSPGNVGVPDRIVILKGVIWFVEVKTPDGRLSPWQEREIKRLIDHGCNVRVVYGKAEVDEFINELR